MPLSAEKITCFRTQLIKEEQHKDELRDRLVKLYLEDTRFHKMISTKKAVLNSLQLKLEEEHLYVGMFNDKPVCCVFAKDNEQTVSLSWLAMHKENKNRGIEEQFVKLINKQIVLINKELVSNNDLISKIIKISLDTF